MPTHNPGHSWYGFCYSTHRLRVLTTVPVLFPVGSDLVVDLAELCREPLFHLLPHVPHLPRDHLEVNVAAFAPF